MENAETGEISLDTRINGLLELSTNLRYQKKRRKWVLTARGEIKDTVARELCWKSMEGNGNEFSLFDEKKQLQVIKSELLKVKRILDEEREEMLKEKNEERKKEKARLYFRHLLGIERMREKLGCNISGGAKHGFAGLGVLLALKEEGLEFDVLIGASAGSILCAILAFFGGLQNIDEKALRKQMDFFERNDVFSLKTLSLRRKEAFFDKAVLERVLKSFFGNKRLEDLKGVILKILATERNSGKQIVLSNTNIKTRQNFLWEAVLASCSIPTLFAPTLAMKDGQPILLTDGSMTGDFWTQDLAKEVDYIVNIYINPLTDLVHNWPVPFRDQILQGVKDLAGKYKNFAEKEFMRRELKKLASKDPTILNTFLLNLNHILTHLPHRYFGKEGDICIAPEDLGLFDMLFVSQKGMGKMVTKGQEAAKKNLPEIKRNLPILKMLLALDFPAGNIFQEISWVRKQLKS